MRGYHSATWWVLSAFSLVAHAAAAQTPVDSFRRAFDLGYVNTGNTAVTTKHSFTETAMLQQLLELLSNLS